MRKLTTLKDKEENILDVFRAEDNGLDVVGLIINNLAMIELDLGKNELEKLLRGQMVEDTCEIDRPFDTGTVRIKSLFDNNTKTLNIKASDDFLIDRDESFILTTDMISRIKDLAK